MTFSQNTIAARVATAPLDILAWDLSDAFAKTEDEHGYDISMDEIKAELPAFLTALLTRVAERDRAAAPDGINPATKLPRRFDGAPRANSHGGVLHVDRSGDPLYGGIPFGHQREVGPEKCARCWELANGAPRREDATGGRGYGQRW